MCSSVSARIHVYHAEDPCPCLRHSLSSYPHRSRDLRYRTRQIERTIWLLERNGWRRQQCGSTKNLEVHHLSARSGLGHDCLESLITLCDACKSNKQYTRGGELLQKHYARCRKRGMIPRSIE